MAKNAKFVIKEQKCTLSKDDLYAFLEDYPIPKQFKIMLPSKHQAIFDAPRGYVGLYTHAFTLSNLRIPLHPLILEFMQYFKVHISRLNPFRLAKLTTYIVMCKAYGYEPSLTVLRGFVNLYPAGDWLTLARRGDAEVPNLLLKPITNISGWKLKVVSFIYKIPSYLRSILPCWMRPTDLTRDTSRMKFQLMFKVTHFINDFPDIQ